MEWHSVHSGIGMRNRKTRAFYILSILIVNKKTRPKFPFYCVGCGGSNRLEEKGRWRRENNRNVVVVVVVELKQ